MDENHREFEIKKKSLEFALHTVKEHKGALVNEVTSDNVLQVAAKYEMFFKTPQNPKK